MDIESDKKHDPLKSFSFAAVSLFLLGLLVVLTQVIFRWMSADNPYVQMLTSAWGGIAAACLLARALRRSRMNDVLKGVMFLLVAAATAVALFLVLGLII